MKTMNLKKLAAAALAAALPLGARAAYEDVGVGARVTGLAHAYTAVADDVYASYYNPAGLALLARPEFGTTYSKLLTGLSDGSNVQNSFMAYAHPLDGGRRGTVAGAWNYFTLGGLYRENQFIGSYGRELFPEKDPGRYYLGGSLKVLERSVGGTPEASDAISNTGVATGAPDPVLQKASKVNLDADLGFLWRPKPRWTVGLMVQHVMEPNVGFSDSEKLGRNVKLGGAYKTPFSTLTGDLRLVSAPDGSMDKVLAAAAEKWLPTLLHGSFGVRGGLALGTRDLRQLSAGLSYKIHRLQFDYGFMLPIGGFTSTSGTHRLGLTFRFGASREREAAYSEAILENLPDLAPAGSPEFKVQVDELARFQRVAIEELLLRAKEDAVAGRLADAAAKLRQASELKPRDEGLAASRERMTLAAETYPTVEAYQTDAAQASVLEGALAYATGDAKEALKRLASARSLKPQDLRIDALAKAIEIKTGLRREEAPAVSTAAAAGVAASTATAAAPAGEGLVDGLFALMEVAMRDHDFAKVVALAERVVAVDPGNALAWKRMGAAQYALGRPADALRAMREAAKYERDDASRAQLEAYVAALAAVVERKAEPATAKARPAARPAAPVDVERLYEEGVELYSQGRLPEAAAAFKKAVEADPNSSSARRALERVQTELLQKGGAK